MNTLESCNITSPFGEMEECAMFIVDEVSVPFTLRSVTFPDQDYTLAFYLRSEIEGDMSIAGNDIMATPEWGRHIINFTASSEDLLFNFYTPGTYYIYHPKLEIGDKDTHWTEAPEDVDHGLSDIMDLVNEANQSTATNAEQIRYVETLIAKLEDTIELVVQGLNSGSKMTQTEDGWVFAMGENKEELENISNLLDELKTAYDGTKSIVNELKMTVDVNDRIASYVKIDETGEQPTIMLGTLNNSGEFGEFALRITNTSIQFIKDNDFAHPIAWISNQELHISRAVLEDELTVGGFVLKEHGTRGNVGWIWKGVTS